VLGTISIGNIRPPGWMEQYVTLLMLAHLVHNMSRFQFNLVFGHFDCHFFFGSTIFRRAIVKFQIIC